MSDTLYKFLSPEFAFKVLEENKLKVSTRSDLNDIYDFSATFLPNDEARLGILKADVATSAVRQTVNETLNRKLAYMLPQIHDTYGIVCLSEGYQSPLLWGHYAKGATGLALGFDSASLHVRWHDKVKVRYSLQRPTVTLPMGTSNDVLLKLLLLQVSAVKAQEWEYEEEVRYLVNLDECEPSGGLYFATFDPNDLREVVAGPRFVGYSYLRRFLHCTLPHVRLVEAVEHPTDYLVTARS
jgi:hypothetical protein